MFIYLVMQLYILLAHVYLFQFAALKCLTKLCDCKVLQKEVLNLNGIQLLFKCLNSIDFELMFTAVQLISNISSDSSSWEPAFQCGGIYQLVSIFKFVDLLFACKNQNY